MHPPLLRLPSVRLLLIGVLVFIAHQAHSGSATWSASPVSNAWGEPANWDPMTVPNDPADIATFATSNNTAVILSIPAKLDGIVFSSAANPFTIAINPLASLVISGAGIENNSGILQTFVLDINSNSHLSGITFSNNATIGSAITFINNGATVAGINLPVMQFFGWSNAGNATFINEGGVVSNTAGGNIEFRENSTAGNATFINNGGTAGGGGGTSFYSSASAGNGTFTSNGAPASGTSAGGVSFWQNSTAGNATLVANGGTVMGAPPARTSFRQNSSAGNATVIANSGVNGGQPGAIEFRENSTAENALLIVNGGHIFFSTTSSGGTARLKMSAAFLGMNSQRSPGVTLGSIEGSGTVALTGSNLIIGGNNLSTTFSGYIYNDSPVGSLTKNGRGTLRLTQGSIDYPGPTIINAGRLLLSAPLSTRTAVTVNSGSVFGGTNFLDGNSFPGATVTAKAGGAILAGDATTADGALNLWANLSFEPGSIIELTLGASGAHSSLARTDRIGTWTFAPNQAFTFLDLGATPGVYDNIISGLAGDPGTESAWTITNAGFAGTFVYDGAGNIDLHLTATAGPALRLMDAASRKMHGSLGPFDVPLLGSGLPVIECRSGGAGGNHTLVFTFNNSLVSGNAAVTSGAGTVLGTPTFEENIMTVNLTGVTDVQKITVTLDTVTDNLSQILPDTTIDVIMLRGDTTGNKTVNGSDIAQIKSQSGTPVTSSNFRADVTADGVINAGDVSLVKSRSGSGAP
jgi:hypothetical protein